MGKQQQCNVGSASGWITYEATAGKQRDGPSILGTLLNGSHKIFNQCNIHIIKCQEMDFNYHYVLLKKAG